MNEQVRTGWIFAGLLLALAFLSALSLFLPQGTFLPLPEEELVFPLPVLALINGVGIIIIYGGLGWLGLNLARKLGFSELYDEKVTNKERFFYPGLAGVAIGAFFILVDLAQARLHSLGRFPHPPFPLSILASATAGIGEEMIFRLFLIPFLLWLLRKKPANNGAFWGVAVFSALVFAFGHFPSLFVLYGVDGIHQFPSLILLAVILLNGLLSLFAAGYFRKYGFLAAVSLHFWTDIVWHVIWGLV